MSEQPQCFPWGDPFPFFSRHIPPVVLHAKHLSLSLAPTYLGRPKAEYLEGELIRLSDLDLSTRLSAFYRSELQRRAPPGQAVFACLVACDVGEDDIGKPVLLDYNDEEVSSTGVCLSAACGLFVVYHKWERVGEFGTLRSILQTSQSVVGPSSGRPQCWKG